MRNGGSLRANTAVLSAKQLQEALRQCGVELAEALTSAGDAAKYVAGLPPHQLREMPHLIFADIKMQGIDGLQLVRWLRRDPVFRDIPMIMLSGSADPEQKAEALQIGATEFYEKPQSPQALKSIVEAVLHKVFPCFLILFFISYFIPGSLHLGTD